MKITKDRKYVQVERYELFFAVLGIPNYTGGFSFECDKDGAPQEYKDLKATNYADCLNRRITLSDGITYRVSLPVIEDRNYSYFDAAEGLCNHCGETVVLSGFTNTCDCGADYNMSGQELAPREQWGEETGESLSDILNIR